MLLLKLRMNLGLDIASPLILTFSRREKEQRPRCLLAECRFCEPSAGFDSEAGSVSHSPCGKGKG